MMVIPSSSGSHSQTIHIQKCNKRYFEHGRKPRNHKRTEARKKEKRVGKKEKEVGKGRAASTCPYPHTHHTYTHPTHLLLAPLLLGDCTLLLVMLKPKGLSALVMLSSQ